MTSRPQAPRTSRDLPGAKPGIDKARIDKAGETQEAAIADAGETEDDTRDLVHGEGGTIDVPARPGDLSKDD